MDSKVYSLTKYGSCFDLSEELINHPELLNQPDRNTGDSCLHYACQRGDLSIVELLLKDPLINIGILNRHRQSPLHWACQRADQDKSYEQIALKLLYKGADINALDSEAGELYKDQLTKNFTPTVANANVIATTSSAKLNMNFEPSAKSTPISIDALHSQQNLNLGDLNQSNTPPCPPVVPAVAVISTNNPEQHYQQRLREEEQYARLKRLLLESYIGQDHPHCDGVQHSTLNSSQYLAHLRDCESEARGQLEKFASDAEQRTAMLVQAQDEFCTQQHLKQAGHWTSSAAASTTADDEEEKEAFKNFMASTLPMLEELQLKNSVHSKVLNTLVNQTVECPKLFWFYPKKRDLREWLVDPMKMLLQDSLMLMVVCPVTLNVVPCGPEGMGWEISMPKGWVKKWGPAILISIHVLQAAILAGRMLGVPLPQIPGANESGITQMVGQHAGKTMGFCNYSATVAKKSMNALWSTVSTLGIEDDLSWAHRAVRINSSGEITNKEVAAIVPKELSGEAYKSIHAFLTSGDNLSLGSLTDQLDGRMKRCLGEDGTVEWVSTEGEQQWYTEHALYRPTLVVAGTVDIGEYSAQQHRPHGLNLSASDWLVRELTHRDMTLEHAVMCAEILHLEGVNNEDTLCALNPDKFHEEYLETIGIKGMGHRTKIFKLYLDVREAGGYSHTSSAAPIDASKIATLDQVTQLTVTIGELQRKLDEVKKHQSQNNNSDVTVTVGGGGGSGALAQAQAQSKTQSQSGAQASAGPASLDVNTQQQIAFMQEQIILLTNSLVHLQSNVVYRPDADPMPAERPWPEDSSAVNDEGEDTPLDSSSTSCDQLDDSPGHTSHARSVKSLGLTRSVRPVPHEKKGYLVKQGQGVAKRWQERYFVLARGELTYYENEAVKMHKGEVLDLAGCVISNPSVGIMSLACATRTLPIKAMTVQEVVDWTVALHEHIDFANHR